MPYKPYWLQRLPDIITALNGLADDIVDRPAFEAIFRLRRRRAIELMHSLGSRRGKRGFVLDRRTLLERLESLNVLGEYHWEERVRPARVIEQLNGSINQRSNGSNDHIHRRTVILDFADKAELTQKLLVLLRATYEGGSETTPMYRQLQYRRFEEAVQALWRHNFREAEGLFAKASVGPDSRISTSAETYLRICRSRIEESCEPQSFDDLYTYGVALLNERRLSEARKQFESAACMQPNADYVYYALAVCFALSGDMRGLCANLRRAIELQPRNRFAARSDPDFQAVLEDPCVRELLALPLILHERD